MMNKINKFQFQSISLIINKCYFLEEELLSIVEILFRVLRSEAQTIAIFHVKIKSRHQKTYFSIDITIFFTRVFFFDYP